MEGFHNLWKWFTGRTLTQFHAESQLNEKGFQVFDGIAFGRGRESSAQKKRGTKDQGEGEWGF